MTGFTSTHSEGHALAQQLESLGQRRADSKGHILIVEDWPPNVLVVSLMLEMCGYSFDVANEGIEALRLFEDHHYDAILMDVGLPDTTGYEITKQIRLYETAHMREPTPIIATTAYAMKGDKEKCLDCGMNDYLSKPLDSSALDRLLQLYVQKISH